jgi:hypothetical protein
MEFTTVGIDLITNVLRVHAVDQHGKVVLTRQIKRDQVGEFAGLLGRNRTLWKRL